LEKQEYEERRMKRTRQNVCSICFDHQTNHVCKMCDHRVCRACDQRWALSSPVVQCAACGYGLDLRAQWDRLGPTFLRRRLREKEASRIVEQEMSMLNETLPMASRKKAERAYKQMILQAKQRGEDREYVRELRRRLSVVLNRPLTRTSTTGIRCSHDSCLGLVSSDGKCNLCARRTCTVCHERVADGEDHVCDEGVVATVALIRRECRPCVKCHAPSHKVEGCSVVWCLSCHTFWDWNTGAVINTRNGTPHNPDHRNWVVNAWGGRRREIDDLPCGGLPSPLDLQHHIFRWFELDNFVIDDGMYILDMYNCIDTAQRLRHRYRIVWDPQTVADPLRVAFLLGDVDRRGFHRGVTRLFRKLHFDRDVGSVLETFVMAGIDLFQRFAGGDGVYTTMTSMQALVRLVNDEMALLGRYYKREVPSVHRTTWRVPGERGSNQNRLTLP
jgi:hypothetical protein